MSLIQKHHSNPMSVHSFLCGLSQVRIVIGQSRTAFQRSPFWWVSLGVDINMHPLLVGGFSHLREQHLIEGGTVERTFFWEVDLDHEDRHGGPTNKGRRS